MSNVIQSTDKNPVVVLNQFIKELDVFIQQSVANIKKMKTKHQQMANFWKGEQYSRFTAALNESIKDAAKELNELQELKKQLMKSAAMLKDSTNN